MAGNTVRVIAVGDIFLGEHPVTLGHGVKSIVKKKSCEFLFSRIRNRLEGADIICGNLEGIISPKKNDERGIRSAIYWGESTCAEALKRVGFNCLFLANNHNAQHGKDPLERTCILLDQNNIKWTGFNSANPDSPIPAVFEVDGLRVALLAYCKNQQYNLDTQILPISEFKNIKRDVCKLRENCDIIIVSLHWGDEFIDYPSPDQIDMAHKIIDMGVCLITGHHSHTMQGIERYKNGLIAYSLGSFVKDLWPRKLRESVILKCELSTKGVEDFNIEHVFINNEYQPEMYQGERAKKFRERVEALSQAVKRYRYDDFESMQKKYEQHVRRLLIKDRFETVIHYIQNIFRYNKKLLLENVILMLKRRIYRGNI
jgi:poly-gamma-glutamate synthesis protein (capsule biosynthesis protein)